MTVARILLVDDHELFREGLAGLINAQPDLMVVGQAEDGLAAWSLALDLQPDLIIMDINMPICDGLEATRLIRADQFEGRIVILTVYDEDDKLLTAIKAGANGYMLKNIHVSEFLQKIRGALEGEATLPPKLAASLVEEYARLATNPLKRLPIDEKDELTSREIEVLNLVAGGATNQEIANQLSITVHTTKSHVRNILTKLHAVNRRHATRLATQRGLLNVGTS